MLYIAGDMGAGRDPDQCKNEGGRSGSVRIDPSPHTKCRKSRTNLHGAARSQPGSLQDPAETTGHRQTIPDALAKIKENLCI